MTIINGSTYTAVYGSLVDVIPDSSILRADTLSTALRSRCREYDCAALFEPIEKDSFEHLSAN